MKRVILASLATLLLIGAAEARPRHPRVAAPVCDNIDVMRPCAASPSISAAEARGIATERRAEWGTAVRTSRGESSRAYVAGTVVGGRPAGCPHRFCGCGASIEVWGRIIPFFNLSSNWGTLPPSAPGFNKVAWRRGHVFVLKEHVSGSTWMVKDYNSGGGKTRYHARSIAGYRIVDPSAYRTASAH